MCKNSGDDLIEFRVNLREKLKNMRKEAQEDLNMAKLRYIPEDVCEAEGKIKAIDEISEFLDD